MRELRIGSLFAGIGGLELGLERAGVGRTVVQVEQDPYCLRVLAHHWPGAKRFTDVRTVGAAELGGIDVLCGGFPCQDVSTANTQGRGLEGERSGLWHEFARIIGEVRPGIVVVENVSNLLLRGAGDVLGTLAALGYDAEWDCIPASAVGAHHQRDRFFLVAYARGGRRPNDGLRPRRPVFGRRSAKESLANAAGHLRGASGHDGPRTPDRGDSYLADAHDSGSAGGARSNRRADAIGQSIGVPDAEGISSQLRSSKGERPGRPAGGGDADANGVGCGEVAAPESPRFTGRTSGIGRSRPGWWAPEPLVGRVAHGIPDRVDRLRCLGNAVVPQVAEFVGGCIVSAFDMPRRKQVEE